MRSQSFRLHTPILAILVLDDPSIVSSDITLPKIPIMVPEGAIVEVESVFLDGTRLVGVRWEHKTVMMLVIDIRERGEPINGANA
jgi:hypothetical protein